MAELERVTRWADALIALHLDPSVWSFRFDNAKTRAGLCDYTSRRITVSRHLAALYDDDEVHQILLHEVAHALAGSAAGHGARWRKIADEIGFTGGRLHDGNMANRLAPWVGICPGGHEHFRFRAPSRPLACGVCNRRFDQANTIRWSKREPERAQSSMTSTSFQNAT